MAFFGRVKEAVSRIPKFISAIEAKADARFERSQDRRREASLHGVVLHVPGVKLSGSSDVVATDSKIASRHADELIPIIDVVNRGGRSGNRKPVIAGSRPINVLKKIPYSELGHQQSGEVVYFRDLVGAIDSNEHEAIPAEVIAAALKHPKLTVENGLSQYRINQMRALYKQKTSSNWSTIRNRK